MKLNLFSGDVNLPSVEEEKVKSTRRSGIMLCYPLERDRLEGSRRIAWNSWPVIVQPKLNGERCRALVKPEGTILLTSEENLFFSVPHINKVLHDLKLWGLELDGELYRHGWPLETIHSVVSRTVNLHPDHKQITLNVFDIVTNGNQLERIKKLMELHHLFTNTPIKFVTPMACNNFDEVIRAYNHYLEQNFEGIIVRHMDNTYVRKRTPYMLKFKPKCKDSYRIVDYKEEHAKDGTPKGTLGALICDGENGETFSIGSGFSEEERATLWDIRDTITWKWATVEYQHLTARNGVPKHSVYISITDERED